MIKKYRGAEEEKHQKQKGAKKKQLVRKQVSQRSMVSDNYGSSCSDSHSGLDENSMSDITSSSGSENSLIFHDDPEAEDNQRNEHGQNPGYNSQGPAYLQGYQNSQTQGRGSHLMPIQFAKEHIIKIEEDMKKMHERHVRLMREMDENYKLIEKETQEYYIEFLQKWKEVAKQKIKQYRINTEQLALEKERVTKEKDQQIEGLNQ